MTQEEFLDYYEILGIPVTATTKEISKAYRKLAPLYHPDKHPDDPNAVDKFHRITVAKDVLTDPVKRGEYDTKMKSRLQAKARREKMDQEQRDRLDKLQKEEEMHKEQMKENRMYNNLSKDDFLINEIRKKDQRLKEKLFGKKNLEAQINNETGSLNNYPDRYFDPNYGISTLERLKKEAERRNKINL